MAAKKEAGCARTAGGPVGESPPEQTDQQVPEPVKEKKPMVKIGKKAPDFTAPAYYRGEFTSIKLSDYAGKWVVLCFYPGDFTFV